MAKNNNNSDPFETLERDASEPAQVSYPFVQWDYEGKRVGGFVASIRNHLFEGDNEPTKLMDVIVAERFKEDVPELAAESSQGAYVTVTLATRQLHDYFLDTVNVEEGDMVFIEYQTKEKISGGRTFKRFRLGHKRKDEDVPF